MADGKQYLYKVQLARPQMLTDGATPEEGRAGSAKGSSRVGFTPWMGPEHMSAIGTISLDS